MKKLISTLLVGSLFLSFTTNVFADPLTENVESTQDEQYAQVLQMLEETNAAIDAKIAVAVEQADGLQRDYIAEIRKIEQSEIDRVQSEITKREEAIASGKYSDLEELKMNKEIADFELEIIIISENLEKNIVSISQDIEAFMTIVGPPVTSTNEDFNEDLYENLYDDLYEAVEVLTENLNRKSKKYKTLTDYYTKKLNEVITDCYDVTLAMSNEAIARAAEKGVQAEASWKLVRFGHLWVWIDPIRVIGRY